MNIRRVFAPAFNKELTDDTKHLSGQEIERIVADEQTDTKNSNAVGGSRAYFIKNFFRSPRVVLIVALFFVSGCLIVAFAANSYIKSNNSSQDSLILENQGVDSIENIDDNAAIPSTSSADASVSGLISSPSARPTINPFPSPSIKPLSTPALIQPTSTPVPTNKPKSTPTPTPTPEPRQKNPPIINISYPSEMQDIAMDDSQSLCIVDSPAGGDTSGLQRKYDLNNDGWTSYKDMYTLCIEPEEGLNIIQLKYRNKYGDESSTYSVQFKFEKL